MQQGIDITVTQSVVTFIFPGIFPAGVTLSTFSDDVDMFDFPQQNIAKAVGTPGGVMAHYATYEPVQVTFSVLPGSEDDKALTTVALLTTPGAGKKIITSTCSGVITRPNGDTISLIQGRMLAYNPGFSGASDGKGKTKTALFSFQSVIANYVS